MVQVSKKNQILSQLLPVSHYLAVVSNPDIYSFLLFICQGLVQLWLHTKIFEVT